MQEKEQEFSFKSFFVPLTTLKAIHIIIIVGFLVFGNALFNGFVWDDMPQIVNNNLYHSLLNIVPIFFDHSFTFYRPLPAIILAGVYTIFGATPFWYHLIQITIHIINTCLIFIIFKKFSEQNTSFILSLIFLVHPMNVEAVSYISSLQIVLSMLFGLLAFLLTLNQRARPIYKFGLLFILLLFSLLSKETGIIFILLVLPFMAINSACKFTKKEYMLSGLSLFSAAFFYGILQIFTTNKFIVNSFNDSPVPIMQATLSERLITLPKIVLFYLQTFLYPKDLAISQNWLVKTEEVNNFIIPMILDILFFVVIFLPVIYFVVKRKRQLKMYVFFLVWFLFSWAIHWNIIPIDMTVAERWFYFAIGGLLGLVGVTISAINVKRRNIKLIAVWVSIIILLLLSWRTIIRNQNWSSSLILYEHDLKISTESYDLENSYANDLLLAKQYDEALPHIKKSIQLAPKYWVNWGNLGVYYEGKDKIDQSIEAFNTAIRNNNNYYHAYFNLMNIYFYRKSPEEAKVYFVKALTRYPEDPQLLFFTGITDYKLGNNQKAMQEIMKAYTITKDANLLKIYSDMQQNIKVK